MIRRGTVLVGILLLLSCSKREKPLRILCAGDSITAASYPARLEALLRREGFAVRVVNGGIPGNTSGEYLGYLRASDMLKKEDPDVVLLQLGTNDVRIDGDKTSRERFDENMREILSRFTGYLNGRGERPRVFLSTVPPVVSSIYPFSEDSERRVVEEINPAIRALADDFDLPLLDHYAFFKENPDLLPEIHPSEAGYRAMAGNWSRLLQPHL